MRPKIWIQVVPQIMKQLINTLHDCKGKFEVNMAQRTLFISDVTEFGLDSSKTEPIYRIQIISENNTKDIFIAQANVREFTVHFK